LAIIGALAFMCIVMAVGWVVQRAVRDSSWVDVFWTFGTGIAGAGVALAPLEGAHAPRQGLVAALILIWSLRLGLHIAARVRRGPEDARYLDLRKQWGDRYQLTLLGFMQLQAPCTALLCLSIGAAAARGDAGLDIRDLAAVLVLIIAIVGEGLADAQLDRFKRSAAPGSVNDRGLWAWSRHPNYFFEWFGWLAYPMMAFDPTRLSTWLTLVAPLVMYLILTRLTGVPTLEAHMAQSRGQAWTDYAGRTPAFFPRPPIRKDAR